MEKYGNPDYDVKQWGTCDDADQIEEALAHLAAAKIILGPVSMRVRAEHRRNKKQAARSANPEAA